jgi:hypothetical protein
MMRRPKHRHHPDIWRERRRAENAWLTRRLKSPELTEEEMRRCVIRVWETALALDDYYGNPAGTLAYSGITASVAPRP